MNGFEMKRFAMQFRGCELPITLEFPREHRGVFFVVAQRFPLRGLMFFAKMGPARFVPRERVRAHQLSKLEKISHPSSALERLIKIFIVPRNVHPTAAGPEFFSKFGDFLKRFVQPFGVARHSTFVPKKKAKFAMDGIERTFAIDIEHFLDARTHVGLCFVKFWRIVWWPFAHLTGEIIR